MYNSSKTVKIRASSFSKMRGLDLMVAREANFSTMAFKDVVGDALVAFMPMPTTETYSSEE